MWARAVDRLNNRTRTALGHDPLPPREAIGIAEALFAEARTAIAGIVQTYGTLATAAKFIAEGSSYRELRQPALASAADVCGETTLISIPPFLSSAEASPSDLRPVVALMAAAMGAAIGAEAAAFSPSLATLHVVRGEANEIWVELSASHCFDFSEYQMDPSVQDGEGQIIERLAREMHELLSGRGTFLPLNEAVTREMGVSLVEILVGIHALQRAASSGLHSVGFASTGSGVASLGHVVTGVADALDEPDLDVACRIVDLLSLGSDDHLNAAADWRPWKRLEIPLRLTVRPLARGWMGDPPEEAVVLSPVLLMGALRVWSAYLGEGQWCPRSYSRTRSEQRDDPIAAAASRIAQTIDQWYEEHVADIVRRLGRVYSVELAIKTETQLLGSFWKGAVTASIPEGDVDVLVFDHAARRVWLLEAKHHHTKFRPGDVGKFLCDMFVGDQSYTIKVQRRVERVCRDLQPILDVRGLSRPADWTVHAGFVVPPGSPAVHWKAMSGIPVVAEHRLERFLA